MSALVQQKRGSHTTLLSRSKQMKVHRLITAKKEDAAIRSQTIHHDLGRRVWSDSDLFFAIAWGDVGRVEGIFRERPEARFERTESGVSPLEMAEWAGHAEIESLVRGKPLEPRIASAPAGGPRSPAQRAPGSWRKSLLGMANGIRVASLMLVIASLTWGSLTPAPTHSQPGETSQEARVFLEKAGKKLYDARRHGLKKMSFVVPLSFPLQGGQVELARAEVSWSRASGTTIVTKLTDPFPTEAESLIPHARRGDLEIMARGTAVQVTEFVFGKQYETLLETHTATLGNRKGMTAVVFRLKSAAAAQAFTSTYLFDESAVAREVIEEPGSTGARGSAAVGKISYQAGPSSTLLLSGIEYASADSDDVTTLKISYVRGMLLIRDGPRDFLGNEVESDVFLPGAHRVKAVTMGIPASLTSYFRDLEFAVY